MSAATSATPQVLLAHHLKQLRLPTMLREYDKVARACASEGVDHPRYLLRLVARADQSNDSNQATSLIWLTSGAGTTSFMVIAHLG
jgi:hypothetical protein